MPNPINPQEYNRYSYVNNNPLKYNDPTGHKKHGFWSVFFAVAFFGPLAPIALNKPAVAAALYGWPGYRAAQAWSKGANFRETATAAANGIGDAYDFLSNPTDAPEIFKSGPTTDHFNTGTRKVLEATLSTFGCSSVCGQLVSAGIEATLTAGNRSYAGIAGNQNGNYNVDIGVSVSLLFLNFQFSLKPNNAFSISGMVGQGSFSGIDLLYPMNQLGAGIEINISEKGSVRVASAFAGLGKNLSLGSNLIVDKTGHLKIGGLNLSVGPSLGSDSGISIPVGAIRSIALETTRGISEESFKKRL